jgi:hypothetical protein
MRPLSCLLNALAFLAWSAAPGYNLKGLSGVAVTAPLVLC